MVKDPSSNFFTGKKKLLALIIVPLALYLKTLFYDFSALDEQWMIVKNTVLLGDWKNLEEVFTRPLAGLYFRPLFVVSVMLDYHLGKLSPVVYHFSNLIFHLGSVILLFRYLLLSKVSQKAAFAFAFLFSVHPLVLHAVAWIPGRNDLMLCFFTLLSLIHLHKYFREQKILNAGLHILFFIAALLTKENAIVLPLVFLMSYAAYQKIDRKKMLWYGMVYSLIIVGWWIARKNVTEYLPSLGGNLSEDLKNFGLALLLFIGKVIVPFRLSVFPTLEHASVIPGILTLIAVTFLVIKQGLADKKIAVLGLVIFFGFLVLPVWFGVTNNSGEHYEHRIYASMIGLCLFLSQVNFNVDSKVISYGFFVIAGFFIIRTFTRMDVYKNKLSFAEAGIKDCPEYYLFYAQKADIFYDAKNYASAIPFYDKAIEFRKHSPELYNNRGNSYASVGRHKEAIADFSKALEVTPDDPDTYLNRCVAYANAGDLENAVKDLMHLKKCCQAMVPPDIDKDIMQRWLAMLIEKSNKQLLVEPGNADLYVVRARLYMQQGLPDKALADLKKACELEPQNALFRSYLLQLQPK